MIPIARPVLGPEEEDAVVRVLRSGRLAQGPEIKAFEREFASVCGVDRAVACANGTAALYLALVARGVGRDDEVIVPSLTFAATANAVLATGARPVFCDVREDDFCIDASDAEARLTAATKAVVPVHLYGQPADMEAVSSLAERHGLALVEDACQAHGSSVGGRRAGSFGAGVFSFYATKNMTTGEGGIVTTSDGALADRVALLRNHGMVERYRHTGFGLNLRMTELQAAIGRVQLTRLETANARRQDNAAFYSAELAGIEGLVLPRELPGRVHVWHQYTVRVPKRRDAVLARLREAGVGAEVYYPTAAHRQPSFADRADGVALPVADLLASEVLSIPVHAALTDAERATVAKTLADAMMES